MSRKEFEDVYSKWVQESESGPLSLASNSELLQELESFQRLVDLGEESLPFVVEKLQDGHFMLNRVIGRITGIRVFEIKKDSDSVLSEQDISKLWIKWWDKNKQE